MKTGTGFFQYFTFLFVNISILWKYILKNCKLRSVFPNSPNLYIFGLQATSILIRFMLYFGILSFLCNHFVTVSEQKINLNFRKYYTITRTDSSSNIITFYAYYFGNHVTLRKDFDQKNFVEIGLLIANVFLKHNINFFIHIFFIQLILSLLTLHWSEISFSHHSKIRLCTTKEFFLIESIKICDDWNNENQYLRLQLNCLNQIKCHKNHFSYVKLILLLSWDITLNTGSIQNNHLKKNWDIFRNRDLHLIHLNINSLLPNIDELREIVKISNPTVIGITETKLGNSICDSEISIDGYCAIRGDRNRKGGGVICYVNNKICYNTENCISNETENIFLELLIPETRPITVGIVYESPDKSRFLEILSNSLNSLNMLREE